MKLTARLFICLLALPLIGPFALHAESVYSAHVEAELVSEVTSIQPGEPFAVGLRMKMDPRWHTYWINPGGEAGLPTKVTWELPEGFSAGPLQWPTPERFETQFGFGSDAIINYGYSDEILVISQITPPDDLAVGSEQTLTAKAQWLSCEKACIPGRATLSTTLPVSGEPPALSSWAELFSQARAHQPVVEHGWGLAASVEQQAIVMQLDPPDDYAHDPGKVYLVPKTKALVNEKVTHELTRGEDMWTLRAPLMPDVEPPTEIDALLLAEHGWGEGVPSLAVQLAVLETLPPVSAANPTPEQLDSESAAQAVTETSLLLALVFAFLGGIILNLMPCVLPVLSLKVLDFVKQANSEHAKAWHHGAIFTLGVLVSFWILAGVLILLRAGGQALGWGFHLQAPGFLLALIALLFIFGLSMFGIFEVGMALAGVGSSTAGKSGLGGSFFSGMLATIVATPCTAPFMAPALGFALAQPAAISLLIFTALGLGMALPYLLLASFPPLLKFVPKPGAWMETFKQLLGFLLMATVVWLLWVLGKQVGNNALGVVLMALVILGLAAWVLGRWSAPHRSKRSRVTGRLVTLVLLIIGLAMGYKGIDLLAVQASGKAVVAGDIAWETFDTDKITAYRAAGRPVFVDFTADWCLSCKWNERVAFKDKVAAAIREHNIVPMKADWTSRDDYITRALAEHGRSGVPLYVLYPAELDREPIILPQLLTQDIVLSAFAKL